MAVVAGLSIVVNLFSYAVTTLIAFGFDEATREMTAPLVAINFYYLDFIFAVSFLAGMLHYRKHFATTAYATALLNIALIIALLLAQGMEKLEIVYYLSYGVLAGGALQLAAHLYAAKKTGVCKVLIAGAKSDADSSDDTGRFKKAFFPAIFASSASHVSAFLDTFLASFLMAGSISYLYYANRILQLPLAVFAIAVSIALFPAIARAIKNADLNRASGLLRKSTWMLMYLLSLSTVGAVILSDEIMWLLFERGAFTREDTLESGWVLMMYMVGLLPFGLAKIFSLWHFSHHRQKAVAKITAVSLIVNIVLSLILIVPMEAAGLALASSLSGVVLFWMNYRLYRKDAVTVIFTAPRLLWLLLSIIAFSLLLLAFKWTLAHYGLVLQG